MNHSHAIGDLDQRTRQTRTALFEAFAALVLERAYDDIRVADIIAKAGVSRSTFYQHYRNKDDILAGTMSGIFSVLADAASNRGDPIAILAILQHWWTNRTVARVILNGPAYRRLARDLAACIDERLQESTPAEVEPVTQRLRAVQLAEGFLGLIRAWLSGEVKCREEDLAKLLQHPLGH